MAGRGLAAAVTRLPPHVFAVGLGAIADAPRLTVNLEAPGYDRRRRRANPIAVMAPTAAIAMPVGSGTAAMAPVVPGAVL